jgi:hypothetical protein
VSDEQDMVVTRHQAAQAAGVTYNTIQLWIRAGRLHPVVPPGKGRPSILWSELVGVMQKTLAKESAQLWDSKRTPGLGKEPAETG